MKINDILNESTEISPELIKERVRDLSTLLRKNCTEIYENFYSKSNNEKFRHQSDDKISYVYKVVQNKEGRKPTDTPLYFHKVADNKLSKLYGIPFRSNSLFTYYRHYTTSHYVVFPFNGYKMLSSHKVEDLFINLRDMYPNSEEIRELFTDFILKYSEFHKASEINNLSILIGNTFPFLGKYTWVKQDDFPNSMNFKTEFEKQFERFYGEHMKVEAPLGAYTTLLKSILEYASKVIQELVDSYKFITKPTDVTSDRTEVMIHSDKFVLVNIKQILTYLVEKGIDISENDLITMLYKNDLTLFEQ